MGSGALTRYEQVLEDAAGATGGLSEPMAGAARRARLALGSGSPGMPAGRASVVAGVAAPLLVGYVLWCLREVQRSGCRRVYFVARDGEVLLAIARRLVPELGLDLDLRYLEGSRRAWLLPAMAELDADRLSAVLGREDRVTVRNCLEWVDLTPELVREPLARAGFPEPSWDDGLGRDSVARVVQLMVGPEVRALVDARAERRTAVTQDYLRQEGLLDDEPYALVDIGWQGTVGRLLTAVLERCGGRAPAVECYFGMKLPRHEAPGRDLHGYMYDEWRGTGLSTQEVDIWVALEMFMAARNGRVEGYRRADDGRVVPVLRRADTSAAAWIDDVRRGIDVFCTELAPTLPLVDPDADVRAPTWEALRTFWLHPTRAEVLAWGGYPFEDDVDTYPIAGHLPPGEMLRSALAGRPRLRRRGTWPAGVWARTPVAVQVLHRIALTVVRARRTAVRARALAAGRPAARPEGR